MLQPKVKTSSTSGSTITVVPEEYAPDSATWSEVPRWLPSRYHSQEDVSLELPTV